MIYKVLRWVLLVPGAVLGWALGMLYWVVLMLLNVGKLRYHNSLHDEHRMVFGARGLGWGAYAITFGRTSFTRARIGDPKLWAHEYAHVLQWRKYWLLFLLLYAGQIVLYGYSNAPFERAARAAEKAA